jgi:transposase
MSTTTDMTIKPCTITELAEMYGISVKTLRTWLKPHQDVIGKRVGWYYTTLQVRIIFERLGYPEGWEE